MKTYGLRDIIGPIMVGPSSSHTAGALALASMARKLFGEQLTSHNGRLAAVNFGIIVLMFLCSAILLPFLPPELSILHNGDTQYPLPSALAVWLLPLVALVLNVGFILQKQLSPMNTLVFVLLFFAMLGTYLSAL